MFRCFGRRFNVRVIIVGSIVFRDCFRVLNLFV